MTRRTKSLVLLSGGPDSAVAIAWALARGPVATLEVDYTGRPRNERRAVERLRTHYRIREHYRAALPARPGRGVVRGSPTRGYVPARNLAFHASAFVAARLAGARWIVAGHLKADGESFTDARRPFFDRLEALANRFRQPGEPPIFLLTPLASATKAEAWSMGRGWRVPLDLTWSCHRDGPEPCRRCDGCRERAAAEATLSEAPRKTPRVRRGRAGARPPR